MSDPTGPGAAPDEALAFFARITASATHEFNNVLSIIDQRCGLLEDLALMAAQGQPLDPDKLREQTQKIGVQVKRGVSASKKLNRFAHCLDKPQALSNLDEVIDEIVSLYRPTAARRRCSLEHEPSAEPVWVRAAPMLLRQCLVALMDAALAGADQGGSILLSASPAGPKAELLVRAADFHYDPESLAPTAAKLVSAVGGSVKPGEDGDGVCIVLTSAG